MSEKPAFTPDEIRETYDHITTISRLATMVDIAAVRAVLDSMHLVDSIMPITDPTGWMKLRQSAVQHQRLAQAFLRFRTVLEEFRPEEQVSE